MSDNEPDFILSISLNFWNLPCLPDVITEATGITPTRIGVKGENNKGGMPIKHNYWVLKPTHPSENATVSDQWESLYKVIEPKIDIIKKISEEYEFYVSFYVQSYKYQAPIQIPAKMMKDLVEIGAEMIDIDLYSFVEDVED